MSDRRAAVLAAQDLLGVPADADTGQVTRAYRHGARRVHPDVNPDADAVTRFLALQAAYQLSLQAARDRHELASTTPGPCEHTTPAAAVFVAIPVAVAANALTLPTQVRASAPWLVAGPVQVSPRAPGRVADVRGRR